MELFGRKPDYFEGHAVASANFFKALEVISRKYDLTYSGLPQDFSQPLTIGQSKVRMNMESMSPNYNPFEMVQRVVGQMMEDVIELFVFHPGYLDQDLLETSRLTMARPLEVKMLISPETKQWLENQDLELINYRDL